MKKILKIPLERLQRGAVSKLCILLLLAGSFSCNQKMSTNESACNVKNPLTDLPWLQEIVQKRAEYPGMLMNIYQCNYNGDAYGFFMEPCVNCFVSYVVLYNCEGEILCDFDRLKSNAKYTWTEEDKIFEVVYEDWVVTNCNLIWTNIPLPEDE